MEEGSIYTDEKSGETQSMAQMMKIILDHHQGNEDLWLFIQTQRAQMMKMRKL